MKGYWINFISFNFYRLDAIKWEGINIQECHRMTEFRMPVKKLKVATVDGYEIQYLFMKKVRNLIVTVFGQIMILIFHLTLLVAALGIIVISQGKSLTPQFINWFFKDCWVHPSPVWHSCREPRVITGTSHHSNGSGGRWPPEAS